MDLYSKYIENDSFIGWVYNPTPELSKFWEAYLLENPQEKETVNVLKEILTDLKTKDAKLSEEDKEEIFAKLLNKFDKKNNQGKVIQLFKKAYKYVAILVLVLIVTNVVFNIKARKIENSFYNEVSEMPLDLEGNTDTQLIIGSNEPLLINEEKSLIEYTDQGDLVLNERDTLTGDIKNEGGILLFNKLVVPYGKRSRITLSDGSVVYLNAGTKFMFPEKFVSDQRTVFLSGEAFFEVAANKEKPFIVKTIDKKVSVEVLGTKFNVSAYPIDSNILTVLTEGKVVIVEKRMFKTQRALLKPGELASWNKNTEKVNIKTVNTDNYTLWTMGLLHFESESIINIVRKIERFYNVEIDFENRSHAKNINVSGKLDLNDKIEETLENLTITTEFKFEIINDKKYVLK